MCLAVSVDRPTTPTMAAAPTKASFAAPHEIHVRAVLHGCECSAQAPCAATTHPVHPIFSSLSWRASDAARQQLHQSRACQPHSASTCVGSCARMRCKWSEMSRVSVHMSALCTGRSDCWMQQQAHAIKHMPSSTCHQRQSCCPARTTQTGGRRCDQQNSSGTAAATRVTKIGT
jgi:hypothetical protein